MHAGTRNVLRLGTKELKSLRTDPVLLLLILYVFSYAVYAVATGVKFEVENASIAIVDEDHSSLSRSLAQAILPPYFKPPEQISANEVADAMDRGRFVFVLGIPPHFEADVLAARKPEIQINVDATAMALAGNGAIDLQNILANEVTTYLQRSQAGIIQPIDVIVHSRFNPNLRSVWFTSVMQVINNITILSIVLTGAALIRERERGTIEHLLVMPVTPFEIMLAKIWANGLVIIVAAMLSLWLLVQTLLQVPVAGSIPLFLAGAVLYQFSVTALGLLIASFTNSMPQFGLLVMPVLVVINLLSGSTTPMESMPEWLQYVMQISSSTQFVAFAQAILYRGAGLDLVWPYLIALGALGAAYFAVSLMRFRRALAS
ncbi:MAG TPA: ABC transporter permease [Rhodopila sp.]